MPHINVLPDGVSGIDWLYTALYRVHYTDCTVHCTTVHMVISQATAQDVYILHSILSLDLQFITFKHSFSSVIHGLSENSLIVLICLSFPGHFAVLLRKINYNI